MIKRLRTYILTTVFIATIVLLTLTYYVESTPKINHLPVLARDANLLQAAGVSYVNGTYDFSGSGTEWMAVLEMRGPTAGENVAVLYIFKTGGVNGNDAVILGPDLKLNQTSSNFDVLFSSISLETNTTAIDIAYTLPQAAVYNIDFGLRVQIYGTGLFIPILHEQIRIATNILVHYNP